MKIRNRLSRKQPRTLSTEEQNFNDSVDLQLADVKNDADEIISGHISRKETRTAAITELGNVAVSLWEWKDLDTHKRVVSCEKLVRPLGCNAVQHYTVSNAESYYIQQIPEAEIDYSNQNLQDEDVFHDKRPLDPADFIFAQQLIEAFSKGEAVTEQVA